MKFFQSICLAASLLLASTTGVDASPIASQHYNRHRHLQHRSDNNNNDKAHDVRRQNSGAKKRLALWEWTLTRDVASYPGIQATAASLSSAPEIAAVMNWDAWQPTEIAGLPFEPMARVPDSLLGDVWNQLLGSLTNQRTAGVEQLTVYFLNEPERQGVSAADAAATWRASFLPLRTDAQYGGGNATTGTRLVGPAPASDEAGSAWLQEFMGYLGDDEKPDLLGVHYYTTQDGAAADEVAAAQAYIQGQSAAYGGLPVIVSEIASTSRDPAVVDAFTRQMAQWLDEQDWVAQYGFFGMSRAVADDFVSPAAQLMDADGNLTPLGLFYAGLE
ncbi:hypothetical protein SLS62_002524 [Diatrype stigma]|uniref:Asl1-like glycosyl hydrolase catalytic domain-containing protein n=1 Tax=Diatrype stigma TaxID=117547 RepID=A0AAN9UU76_9PEZI